MATPNGQALPTTYGLATMRACRLAPYMRDLITALQPVYDRPGVATMAVDKHWRVYVNRAWLATLDVDTAAGVVLHEVSHLWLRHHARANAVGPAIRGMDWNLATDAEINRALRGFRVKLPDGAVYPEGLKLPPGHGLDLDTTLAEGFYAKLGEGEQGESPKPPPGKQGKPEDGEGDGSGSGTGDGESESESGDGDGDGDGGGGHGSGSGPGEGKHGSGAGGDSQAGDWELPADDKDAPPVPGWRQGQTLAKTAGEIVKTSQSQGNVPGEWARRAGEMLAPPVIPWQDIMRPMVTTGLDKMHGDDENTYRRLSRRAWVVGAPWGEDCIPLPVKESPAPDIVAVLDTSGSMGDGELAEAVACIQSIARATGAVLTIIDVDAQAGVPRLYNEGDKIELGGGGGTDMRVGVEAGIKLGANVVVVVTDGYTPWHDTPPEGGERCQVIVALTKHGAAPDTVPAWMKALTMKDY